MSASAPCSHPGRIEGEREAESDSDGACRRSLVPLSLVLSDPKLIWALRRNNKRINAYLVHNSDNLIDLAFSDENEELNIFAFRAMMKLNTASRFSLIPKVVRVCNVRLELGFTSGLSKLASYMEDTIAILPETVSHFVGCIKNLLSYADQPSVMSLLNSLVDRQTIASLCTTSLLDDILLETQKSQKMDTALCLYGILVLCAQTNQFHTFFESESFIRFICQPFHTDNFRLLSERWSLINLTLTHKSEMFISCLIEDAVHGIDLRHAGYLSYQVSQLNFLATVLTNQPKSLFFLEADAFVSSVTRVFVQFPAHTFSCRACIDLMIVSSTIDYLMSSVVALFVPTAALAVVSPENRVQSAFAREFIYSIHNESLLNPSLSEKLQTIPDRIQRIKNLVLTQKRASHDEYGRCVDAAQLFESVEDSQLVSLAYPDAMFG